MISKKIITVRMNKFRSLKRSYFSFLILVALLAFSLVLEVFINNKALMVSYKGEYFFPVFQSIIPGNVFDLEYNYETNYRALQKQFEESGIGNWAILPFIPYDPFENDLQSVDEPPPHPPSFLGRHFLGTDTNGRDVLARLFYGFRIAIFFSFALYICVTVVGVFFGCLMGYFGGWFDLCFQRVVEIWSTLPTLYIIIILSALVSPSPTFLLIIFISISWTGMTWLLRAEIYREKNRPYCEAARSMGAGHFRIIFYHLLPNSVVPIIAALPFQMVAGIGMLTSLDYLGYGLPIPTPSWGEMLKQGQETFNFAPWILLSPAIATIVVLILFTFIGEGIRESFDPKKRVFYD